LSQRRIAILSPLYLRSRTKLVFLKLVTQTENRLKAQKDQRTRGASITKDMKTLIEKGQTNNNRTNYIP
jgi:hypothetical protein